MLPVLAGGTLKHWTTREAQVFIYSISLSLRSSFSEWRMNEQMHELMFIVYWEFFWFITGKILKIIF